MAENQERAEHAIEEVLSCLKAADVDAVSSAEAESRTRMVSRARGWPAPSCDSWRPPAR